MSSLRDLYVERGYRPEGNELVGTCPFCGKDNHHYVNAHTGVSYCFRCGYGKGLHPARLLCELFNVSLPDALRVLGGKRFQYTEDVPVNGFLQLQASLEQLRARAGTATVTLPAGAVPISQAGQGSTRYLRMRGVSRALWALYDIRYVPPSVGGRYSGHLIFPCYTQRKRLQFYTSRTTDRVGIKSFNPKDVPKADSLLGLHACDKTKPVFLVEGPFDMLALPRRSVALMGKFLSVHQEDRIACLFKEVIVALDSDASDAADEIALRLKRRGLTVSVCKMKRGDPGDLLRFGTAAVPWLEKKAQRCDAAWSVLTTARLGL